ncbi:hypothetical protein [Paraburkholderia sp. JHI869]|uniref:hypothetical protein n=1 Tax=Paraburkholderia sp. JHI869 TaxID=3112959 RepID=UPI00317CEB2D
MAKADFKLLIWNADLDDRATSSLRAPSLCHIANALHFLLPERAMAIAPNPYGCLCKKE